VFDKVERKLAFVYTSGN
jgi:hypothetical protein